MKGGIDYADLYFQVSRQESWSLEDGIVREGSFSHDQGVTTPGAIVKTAPLLIVRLLET